MKIKRVRISNVNGVESREFDCYDWTSSDGSTVGMSPMRRYKLAEALRLQGLPEDHLDHCPMTADGKLKAVANGVPIALGRALARAIRECLGLPLEAAS